MSKKVVQKLTQKKNSAKTVAIGSTLTAVAQQTCRLAE